MYATRIVNTINQAVPQNGTTHRQNTVSSTAEAILNFTLAARTTHVLVQFNGADARVTFDGATDPTTTLGFLYTDGSSAYLTRDMAINARAIRSSATDVVLEIQELNYLVH